MLGAIYSCTYLMPKPAETIIIDLNVNTITSNTTSNSMRKGKRIVLLIMPWMNCGLMWHQCLNNGTTKNIRMRKPPIAISARTIRRA